MKVTLVLAAALMALHAHAADPGAADFQWRATLDTGGRSGLVRASLPADALARLQSPSAADLRVFDAKGQPVPFALAAPAQPNAAARTATAAFPALQLHTAVPGRALPAGAVQLKVDSNSAGQSVWVQMGGTPSAAEGKAQKLPAALFDTRKLQDPVTALVLKATLPPNAPVRISASSSADLENWTPIALQGRVYRFEGDNAPANDRLELREPLRLQDRYLRLEWTGQQGVAIESVTGLVSAGPVQPERPAITLPAPQPDADLALEWGLPFATPVAQLEITTPRANTLLPLRILGRNRASEPWRFLGSAVVYRLGEAGQESVNLPAVLQHPSVRMLRVEATHGTRLQGVPIAVRVLFDPVDLVFVAGADGPYQLAAGREATAAAALPIGMLAATTTKRLADLPLAQLRDARSDPVAAPPAWLPRGLDARSAGLWAVLLAAVLVLGGVAWSLLRQLRRGETPPPA
ncbi:DUF3999 domain-containing protein [Ramlibacter sp. XY19]|uniref:DUF3999 family protein n=1 Tax=Ramlibacter paludis TaxID=2908000 RepID=UPI0023DB4016|nr:DUF3999 family protein [Ramlibacter paludis]MCG2591933.1 DUF3999 domain-containing protein [Ramlibacter paludis]